MLERNELWRVVVMISDSTCLSPVQLCVIVLAIVLTASYATYFRVFG